VARNPQLVKSVAHALDILDQFTPETPSLSLADLTRRLYLSKSAIYHLLATLESRGYVKRNHSNGKYSLGLKLFQLGSLGVSMSGLSEVVIPYLTQLRDTAGETIHLGVVYKESILYVAKVESLQTIRMSSRIGGTSPLYCTGVGKVLLANQSLDFIESLLAKPLKRFTSNTIIEPSALREELTRIRAQGYALDREEHEPHVRCVAAPLRDHTGTVVAAISVSGPDIRMTEEKMASLVPQVLKTALVISQQMGFSATQTNASSLW